MQRLRHQMSHRETSHGYLMELYMNYFQHSNLCVFFGFLFLVIFFLFRIDGSSFVHLLLKKVKGKAFIIYVSTCVDCFPMVVMYSTQKVIFLTSALSPCDLL